jgi:DNA-binding NtrC family response regulator
LERRTTIFVVDDDDGVRSLATTVLEKGGYDVRGYDSIKGALAGLREGTDPSLVVLDGIFPGEDAYDFFDQVGASKDLPTIHVLMISDMLDLSRIKDRPKIKIAGRLDKPFSPDKLMKAVLGALADETDATG